MTVQGMLRTQRLIRGVWIAAIPLAGMLSAVAPVHAGEIWVNIDTGQRVLYLMDGDRVVRSFDNISIGKNGATPDKLGHDGKTPLGSFRIRRINPESRFHLFFGLDYPSVERAADAYMADQISAAELEDIFRAHELGLEPSAATPLGGAIGIHGIGNGDPNIHEDFDWTDGCVAVTNEQVDELAGQIGLGTRVVIGLSPLP